MKHLSGKKTSLPPRKTPVADTWEPGILADSLEVMEEHTQQKIRGLEASLNQLTIADHTAEIIFLCGEIKKERILLAKIALKRRRAGYSC